MNQFRVVASFCLFVGSMMVIQWLFFLLSGSVPELVSAPLAIAFHLAAEGSTAVLLIVAGIALWRQWPWALPATLLALGMLIYAMVNSAGYFAQQAEWVMVAMFGLLLLVTLFCIRTLVAMPQRRGQKEIDAL
ncbi:MAG: hypothetical protein R6X32_03890 [Chloroflexota bacterium]|jgi:hypothetical protein